MSTGLSQPQSEDPWRAHQSHQMIRRTPGDPSGEPSDQRTIARRAQFHRFTTTRGCGWRATRTVMRAIQQHVTPVEVLGTTLMSAANEATSAAT
eukprot:1181207-Prorocentrum_minimum.AAC.1